METKKATSMKYRDLRQKSQDQIEAEQLEWQIEDAQEQLEADLKATSRRLKLERQELLCLKSTEALDFQEIFAKIDLIEGLEQAVIRFEKLKEELF